MNSVSEANPGRVTVTGLLDREAESSYTINIQVGITRNFMLQLLIICGYTASYSRLGMSLGIIVMYVIFLFRQAWRTNAAGDVRSAVSVVSVAIDVLDVNDNTPSLANSLPSTITLREVSTYAHICNFVPATYII